MSSIECRIIQCKPLSRDIYLVRLEADHEPEFLAGQYLELIVPGEAYCFFSIANAPGSKYLELHIQVAGDETASSRIIEFLENSSTVQVKLPMGECTLASIPEEQGPLLLIAAGTGFSQIKAICESLFKSSLSRPLHFYWTSRSVSGLYMADLAEKWHAEDLNFHFSAIVSEHNDWQDKQALLYQAIIEDMKNLPECQAIACGSPEMVYATLDHLVEHGFRNDQMISDVFSYAPREK